MGIAIQSIYDPVGMVVGGFTGVAILIRQLTVKWFPEEFRYGLRTWR